MNRNVVFCYGGFVVILVLMLLLIAVILKCGRVF